MDLLKNACLSIKMGIEDINSKKNERMLSAIRNLHAGIILLFKEKLRRMSPANSNDILVKEKIVPIEQDGKIILIGAGKNTIHRATIKNYFDRLSIHVDWGRVDELAMLRNEIEHYCPEASPKVMHETLMKTLILVTNFMQIHLKENPLDHFSAATWNTLIKKKEAYEIIRAECFRSLSKMKWESSELKQIAAEYAVCGHCESSLIASATPEKSTPKEATYLCKACTASFSFDEFITACLSNYAEWDEYDQLKYGADPKIGQCPSCNNVSYLYSIDKCVLCDYTLEFDECKRCGAPLNLLEQSM